MRNASRNIERQLEDLKRENNNLKAELMSYKKAALKNDEFLNSRRVKLANSLANRVNSLLPKGSRRRKVFALPVKALRRVAEFVRNRRERRRCHGLELALSEYILEYLSNGKQVVIYDTIWWDSPLRQRPHHMAEQMANLGIGVIYLDRLIQQPTVKVLADGIVMISGHEFIMRAMGSHFKNGDFFYILPSTQSPPRRFLRNMLKLGSRLVYEYIDDFDEAISGAGIHNQLEIFNNLEKYKPALLLASADKLADQLVERFQKDKILISKNAVNIEHFDYSKHSYNMPKDMKKVVGPSNPVVGFYGAIAPWLDYDLIKRVARALPNYDFVFIGPDYHGGLSDLPILPNVHHLGPKGYELLPRYACNFDCAIIPFAEGDIAKSTSPVKLFEYMAMGLPTVCTKDLRECKGYDWVYIAKDLDDFIKGVKRAVKLKGDIKVRKRLLEQANNNTWRARAEDLKLALEKLRKA